MIIQASMRVLLTRILISYSLFSIIPITVNASHQVPITYSSSVIVNFSHYICVKKIEIKPKSTLMARGSCISALQKPPTNTKQAQSLTFHVSEGQPFLKMSSPK